MIQVTVNGEAREFAVGSTISAVLSELGLHPQLVVVEHNREILDRAVLDATEVREGDQLELVHFVGGG
jgi:thiamine biosynthesis protein ThiS